MRIKGLKNRNLEFRAGGNLSVDEKGEFEVGDLKFGLKGEARTKKDLIIHIIYLTDRKHRRYDVYQFKNRRPKS